MKPKYVVHLSDEQRRYLEKLISSGTCSAQQIKRAQILLKLDAGWSYKRIIEAFKVAEGTITRVRKTFVKQGLEAALQRKKPNREYPHKLDGEQEAHLIALACSQPPDGRSQWSLRLLRDKYVQLGYPKVSHETIRRMLKKTNLSPG